MWHQKDMFIISLSHVAPKRHVHNLTVTCDTKTHTIYFELSIPRTAFHLLQFQSTNAQFFF